MRNGSVVSVSRHKSQPGAESLTAGDDSISPRVNSISSVSQGVQTFLPPHDAGKLTTMSSRSTATVMQTSAGSGAVLKTSVMQFEWLISKSWIFVLLAVIVMQLYLLLRLSNEDGKGGPGQQHSGSDWSQDRKYWAQRMATLHQELHLLRSRSELVTKEVSASMGVLCGEAGGDSGAPFCAAFDVSDA